MEFSASEIPADSTVALSAGWSASTTSNIWAHRVQGRDEPQRRPGRRDNERRASSDTADENDEANDEEKQSHGPSEAERTLPDGPRPGGPDSAR